MLWRLFESQDASGVSLHVVSWLRSESRSVALTLPSGTRTPQRWIVRAQRQRAMRVRNRIRIEASINPPPDVILPWRDLVVVVGALPRQWCRNDSGDRSRNQADRR